MMWWHTKVLGHRVSGLFRIQDPKRFGRFQMVTTCSCGKKVWLR